MARTAHGRTAHQSHADERILYHGGRSMFFCFLFVCFFREANKKLLLPRTVFIDGDMINLALGE